MTLISLTPLDLALAALLVLALAAVSVGMRLRQARGLLIAALRTAVQLALVGLVLEVLFAHATLGWVALMAGVMLLLAGREAAARPNRRFSGGSRFASRHPAP